MLLDLDSGTRRIALFEADGPYHRYGEFQDRNFSPGWIPDPEAEVAGGVIVSLSCKFLLTLYLATEFKIGR
jgi:hypothetical protein